MAGEGTITVADGRTVGFYDYGPDDATAVLWSHGGPGSRMEPAAVAPEAAAAGYRIVGIDRPGYGLSTPRPGRSIADWVPDGIAVADHLGIDRFAAVGVSTGGAYALATAALHPDRVIGVIACCALTDMQWEDGRKLIPGPATHGIWDAPDRETALGIAAGMFGEDGSGMAAAATDGPPLPPADLALFADPAFMTELISGLKEMFAFGPQGYTDDRIADGVGWVSFDVSNVCCPVVVLHGGSDTIAHPGFAPHTAEIVPGATLRMHDDLGHFSIVSQVVPTLTEMRLPRP